MRTTKQEKRIMLLLAILLLVTVGYALLSQTLNINGTAKIDKTTWKIYWDNVVPDTNLDNAQITQAATITNQAKTLVEYSVNLKKPGDYYEFTVDAVNEGTIDAMIRTFSNKVDESNGITEVDPLPAYLDYTVTYSDGQAVAQNQLLKANSTETYKVRVAFKEVDPSLFPTDADRTLTFKFGLEYVQADENGIPVVHGFTGTKYRTMPYKDVYIGDNVSTGVTLFDSADDAMAAYGNKPVYLKYVIENDIVKESYVVFKITAAMNHPNWKIGTYYLRGGVDESSLSEKPIYEANKATIEEAFQKSCGNDSVCDTLNEDFSGSASTDGNIIVGSSESEYGCSIINVSNGSYETYCNSSED